MQLLLFTNNNCPLQVVGKYEIRQYDLPMYKYFEKVTIIFLSQYRTPLKISTGELKFPGTALNSSLIKLNCLNKNQNLTY